MHKIFGLLLLIFWELNGDIFFNKQKRLGKTEQIYRNSAIVYRSAMDFTLESIAQLKFRISISLSWPWQSQGFIRSQTLKKVRTDMEF